MATRLVAWIKRLLRFEVEKTVEKAPRRADGFADGPSDGSTFVKHLPLSEWGFENCPAVPYWANQYGDPDLTHIAAMLASLDVRGEIQAQPAYHGLSNQYTIQGQTNDAYEFLYNLPLPPAGADRNGAAGSPAPNELALDKAADFTLPWTTFENMYGDSQDLGPIFAGTLSDADGGAYATKSFWPTIANFGLPYNLVVLAKVDAARASVLQADFGQAWTDEGMTGLQKAGLLYEIDMTILESVGASTALDDSVRFTPATITVLKQHDVTKELTPIAIRVWTDGVSPRVYTVSDENTSAWLYALQAAKTSITVWGIWLGHVYHWHLVTAAMQMSMYNQLPAGHRLYPLLQPQSQSLIDFDFVLLTILWGQISPPTPVAGYMPFLRLVDKFADGRTFSADDPLSELAQRKLVAKDFTVNEPWDAYPVVKYVLELWKITGAYVSAVVDDLYKRDTDVASDQELQAWMKAAGAADGGNVQGLPQPIQTREQLAGVLTSILYRITVHGAGSLNPSVNPALSFVSNFPPCLQSSRIPEPNEQLTPKELLELLPHTGTIGGMTTFYYTFVYSQPDVPLIPKGGPKSAPYFPPTQPNCNKALIAFRTRIGAFVDEYVKAWNEEVAHIRGGPVGPVPTYAQNQAEQWSLSIEI